MTDADLFRAAFVTLEVNDAFTEAVVVLGEDDNLHFCHKVKERAIRARGNGAAHWLSKIERFRLNAKHLDIQFKDGTRWEALLGSR